MKHTPVADRQAHWEIAPELGQIGVGRHLIGGFAADAGFDVARVEEVQLAVSEALTNAMAHGGGSYGRDTVDMTATLIEDWLEVRVRDHGTPTTAPTQWISGYGLRVIRRLADFFAAYRCRPSGTEVCMRFCLSPHG